MHGDQNANDCAHRICRIDLADAGLTMTFPDQDIGKQRERHAGHESRRQHDGQCNGVAGDVETGIAGVVGIEGRQQPLHPAE